MILAPTFHQKRLSKAVTRGCILPCGRTVEDRSGVIGLTPNDAEGWGRMSARSISSDELAKTLEQYRRDYETRLQSRPNIQAQQARQLIQKARDLIRQSGIGDALTILLKEVKYWPSWSQRDDLVKSVHFPATDIRTKEESKEEPFKRTTTTAVYFAYGDKPYGLVFEDRGLSYLPDGEPSRNGTLDFIAEDAIVLSLNVSNHADGHEWQWFDLNALTIGPWTKDLLEIAAHIKVADSRQHFNEKSDIDKAKKISL